MDVKLMYYLVCLQPFTIQLRIMSIALGMNLHIWLTSLYMSLENSYADKNVR